MLRVLNPLFKDQEILLPENTKVVSARKLKPVEDLCDELRDSFENPIGTKPLSTIAKEKKRDNKAATAVIVISDNTRPVPYKRDGILFPIVEILLQAGFKVSEITILIATGMHEAMSDKEVREIIDDRIFSLGIKVLNHESQNQELLTYIGKTKRGTPVYINKRYVDSELKILTGLVEPHFMAGFSGGRKSICPGLIGRESTIIFHGPELMEDINSRELSLENNPVHEESWEVAKMVPPDFIVNVTLDEEFNITGIFSGELEKAHEMAARSLIDAVRVKLDKEYDIVITHGGFVGLNHYQCAKCAISATNALKKNGYLLIIANNKDGKSALGSVNYQVTLGLLNILGPKRFTSLIKSPDWHFLQDQWQVQQWCKLFDKIPKENLFYYSPQIKADDFNLIPGNDMRKYLNGEEESYNNVISQSLVEIEKRVGKKLSELDILFLQDGPYMSPYYDK